MFAQKLEAPIVEKRRDRLRAMMRREILDAARSILRNQGIRELTMRALAGAVGVTAPTLYDYFDSKERVLDALYLEGVERVYQDFEDAVSGHAAGIAQLGALAAAYRAFALDDPELFQLIFGRIDKTYFPEPEVKAHAKTLFEILVTAVVVAIDTGGIRPVDPVAAAVGIWSTVHGVTVLEINGMLASCSPNGPDVTFGETVEHLFQGYATRV